jgi:hypothetical protein
MRWLLGLAAVALFSGAFGDGGMYTREVLAAPTIPHQRALVSFKDGVEVMIVESRVRGGAGDYGWLVPVPSKTVKVEPASPGLFDSLDFLMQPQIRRFDIKPWTLCVWLAGLTVLLAVVLLARARGGMKLGEFVVWSALVGVFCLIAAPTVTNALSLNDPSSKGATAGADGPTWRTVGSYQYAQVDSGTTGDPLGWLKSEGFAARRSEETIKDYLDEGWSFVALRFVKGESDMGPHPIKLTFDCKEPVYPMRLTRHNAKELALDLYVIGSVAPDTGSLVRYRLDTVSTGQAWSPIGHPEVREIAEDGDAIARYTGELDNGDMAEDVTLGRSVTDGPAVSEVWSPDSAEDRTYWLLAFCACCSGWLYCAMVVALKPARRGLILLSLFWVVVAFGVPLVERARMHVVETELSTLDRFGVYAVGSLDKNRRWASREEIQKAIADKGGPGESDRPFGYSIVEYEDRFELVAFDGRANPQEPIALKKTSPP